MTINANDGTYWHINISAVVADTGYPPLLLVELLPVGGGISGC